MTTKPTLCLGEAIVDLICERPGASFAAADRFAAHLGGVSANTAVFAARAGAPVAIAGAVGHDRWGRWLRERLGDEHVDVSLLRPRAGETTQLAFVALDAAGEPEYRLYPSAASPLAGLTPQQLHDAVANSGTLLINSNTLSEAVERELTMCARARALSLGLPIVLDCNLRLHRWASAREAIDAALQCVPGTRLVRANAGEAAAITGASNPDAAARRLLALGAQLAVVTLGADGVLLRGRDGRHARVSAPVVGVRSVVGAGDAFTGTLLAALGGGDEGVQDALPAALDTAARACEWWGACD
jgi:sugar/nucleoside kinase (ribokinase family)